MEDRGTSPMRVGSKICAQNHTGRIRGGNCALLKPSFRRCLLVYDSPAGIGIGDLQNEPREDARGVLSGTQFDLSLP